METSDAIRALAALAHQGRLEVFRLLVRAGPLGMAAGDIARSRGLAPNTLSTQLAILTRAGLVTRRPQGRSVVYAADFDGMTGLIDHLVEDCCDGRPEVCAPLAGARSLARR